MLEEPGLFDAIDAEKKETKRQEYLDTFKYLDHVYVDGIVSFRYKSPVYSSEFQLFLNDLNELRRELGYERITQSQAFERAVALETKHGFDHAISFSTGKIDAQKHIDNVNAEMNRLGFRPDYSGCYDGGDNRQAEREFETKFARDYDEIRPVLNIVSLPPLRLDFDDVVKKAIDGALKSLGQPEFALVAAGQQDLTKSLEEIVSRAMPELAKRHIIIEKKNNGPV